MPVESKQSTRVDLQPEEIIRAVKMRFRICSYVFNTGAIWMLVSGVGGLLNVILRSPYDPLDASSLFTVMMIGVAINTVGFAITLAIYRCPACDTYLGRLRKDKLRCPGCDAKVK